MISNTNVVSVQTQVSSITTSMLWVGKVRRQGQRGNWDQNFSSVHIYSRKIVCQVLQSWLWSLSTYGHDSTPNHPKEVSTAVKAQGSSHTVQHSPCLSKQLPYSVQLKVLLVVCGALGPPLAGLNVRPAAGTSSGVHTPPCRWVRTPPKADRDLAPYW